MVVILIVLLLQLQNNDSNPMVVQQAINWTTILLATVNIVPASIAAIVAGMALLQGRRNAEVAAGTDKKVDAVKKDGEHNGEKLVEIHTLTNSNLAAVTEELKAAKVKIEGFAIAQTENNKRIEGLQQMLADLAKNVVPATAQNTGGPPLPVHDEEAVEKLDELIKGQVSPVIK